MRIGRNDQTTQFQNVDICLRFFINVDTGLRFFISFENIYPIYPIGVNSGVKSGVFWILSEQVKLVYLELGLARNMHK